MFVPSLSSQDPGDLAHSNAHTPSDGCDSLKLSKYWHKSWICSSIKLHSQRFIPAFHIQYMYPYTLSAYMTMHNPLFTLMQLSCLCLFFIRTKTCIIPHCAYCLYVPLHSYLCYNAVCSLSVFVFVLWFCVVCGLTVTVLSEGAASRCSLWSVSMRLQQSQTQMHTPPQSRLMWITSDRSCFMIEHA